MQIDVFIVVSELNVAKWVAVTKEANNNNRIQHETEVIE
jgi:hypothetical protein